MEGPCEEDAKETKDMFMCSLCQEFYKNPHKLDNCSHSFCKECCGMLLARKKCSECGTVFTNYAPNSDLAK